MINQPVVNLKDSPKFPEKLTGSFWGITTFFNPQGYKNKLEHYKVFRENAKRQGLKLLVIECALKDNGYEIQEEDADILVRVKSNSVLWHKERLLNIALKHLPVDCDKIIWIDCDVIILNDNWIKETAELLEDYIIVKPFSKAIRLDRKETKMLIKNNSLNDFENKRRDSAETYSIENNPFWFLSVFGIAARRKTMDKIGFFDTTIAGNGDSLMISAFLNIDPVIPRKPLTAEINQNFLSEINNWNKMTATEIRKSIAALDGIMIHLFHGSLKEKKYDNRFDFLADNGYNPKTFLTKNEYDCYEWTEKGQKLGRELEYYFLERNETGSLFTNIYAKIIRPDITIKRLVRNNYERLDRIIGKVGIILKKYAPSLYRALKGGK